MFLVALVVMSACWSSGGQGSIDTIEEFTVSDVRFDKGTCGFTATSAQNPTKLVFRIPEDPERGLHAKCILLRSGELVKIDKRVILGKASYVWSAPNAFGVIGPAQVLPK